MSLGIKATAHLQAWRPGLHLSDEVAGLSHVKAPRERELPGAMANLIKRLTMVIFARPHEVDLGCCFPQCHAPITDQLEHMPLCTVHLLRVWKRVESKLDPREIQTWLSGRGEFKLPDMPDPSTLGYVYFVRLGNRVKIGYSRNPAERFKTVPVEEVLVITPGGEQDERAAHIKFAHLRTTGEWFKAAPELLRYAKSLPRT